jgi:flagellar hook assembly protein FlgD
MVQGLSPGVTYYVAIRTCDHAGNWSGISNVAVATTTSIGVGTDDENADVPSDFQLRQNYPNPFNPSTTIEFSIPRNEQVQLVIFNVLGERVTTLLSDYLAAGHHQVTWNGNDLYGKPVASGVYLYRLEAGSKVWVRKMALLK